jgi:hypothetical protein
MKAAASRGVPCPLMRSKNILAQLDGGIVADGDIRDRSVIAYKGNNE